MHRDYQIPSRISRDEIPSTTKFKHTYRNPGGMYNFYSWVVDPVNTNK